MRYTTPPLIRLAALVIAAAAAWAAGQTPGYGWYSAARDTLEIRSAHDLAGLAQIVNGTAPREYARSEFVGKTIVLRNGINMAGFGSNYNGGRGWIPIGNTACPFRGTFDGRGYEITGLYINNGDLDYAGLFGFVGRGGIVRSVGVVGVNIRAASYLGGIAGLVEGGIENSYSAGSVEGEVFVGGTAGTVRTGGAVTRCYFSGNVSGALSQVGGITGEVSADGGVANSYSVGVVSGVYDNIGGVAGLVYGGVANSYSASVVSGGSGVGGVVGRVGASGSVSRSYSSGNVSGSSGVGGVAGSVDGGGSLRNCAALSDSVAGGRNVGPVAGRAGAGVLERNAAFAGMKLTAGGVTVTAAESADTLFEPVTALSIAADGGTVGGRFVTAGAGDGNWATHCDSLPGLLGAAAARPEHLRLRFSDFDFRLDRNPVFTGHPFVPDSLWAVYPNIPDSLLADSGIRRVRLRVRRGEHYEHVVTTDGEGGEYPNGGVGVGGYRAEIASALCGASHGSGFAKYDMLRESISGLELSEFEVEEVTLFTITIKAVGILEDGELIDRAVEYAISTRNDLTGGGLDALRWQDSVRFTGLEAGRVHYIYIRAADKENYDAGDAQVRGGAGVTETLFYPITGIVGIPDSINYMVPLHLTGRAVPDTAVYRDSAIIWSVDASRSSGAFIRNDTLYTSSMSTGPITLKATIRKGRAWNADFETTVDVHTRRESLPRIPSGYRTGRVIPGPSPAKKTGAMTFYRTGRRVEGGRFVISDITGNVVRVIAVGRENAPEGVEDEDFDEDIRRALTVWDLRNKSGRRVPAGTYLLTGVLRYNERERDEIRILIGVAE